MTAATQMAVTSPGGLAGEVRALAVMVGEARDQDTAVELAGLARELVAWAGALPVEARPRVVSLLGAARIHLTRAGVEFDLTRALVQAGQALTAAVEVLEVWS